MKTSKTIPAVGSLNLRGRKVAKLLPVGLLVPLTRFIP